MVSLVILFALFGCTLGQYKPNVASSPEAAARILSQSQDGPNPDGSYAWSYETDNGISARENGVPKAADTLAAQGEFKFTALDGTPIQLIYVADENGFQPQGAHLPTPPPIPDAILKSLEYNAQHPEEDDSQNPGLRSG
ncbi:endocuticle structural glycoprotein SgAbd-2-like [Diorhabda sublineata]|uniref:endocuticle structural glycoprotein SgAbd-2-like n=1 Tax=Diorhabda sublineata TaxID=1163346 RepID=UPI0024E16A5B|nr:endocuticle structural glycoprotein SgAbd-2-like [Diorhabda sublineata]